jgi:hypothetical protein
METDVIVTAVSSTPIPEVAAVVLPAPAAPGQAPELPTPSDLAASVVCLVASELIKAFADTRDAATAEKIKRLLPVLVIFIGVVTKTAIEYSTAGEPLQTAAMRGAVAGAMAVYAHSAGKGATGSSTFLTDLVKGAAKKVKRKKKVDAAPAATEAVVEAATEPAKVEAVKTDADGAKPPTA